MSDADAATTAAWSARYDRQTEAVMERVLAQDASGVDVGCHRGAFLRRMLAFAPAGRHFAFEPLPDLHARLVEEFAAEPRVTISPLALSDRRGRARFQHVVTNPAYSGFRLRRYDRPGERVAPTWVETGRLDDLLPAEVAIRFVKIDVEGAELQVLRGAVETLRRHRPTIVFEHGLGAADWYETGPEDLHALLVEECGLRIHLMERWLRGAPALVREEFADRFHSGSDHYFMACP